MTGGTEPTPPTAGPTDADLVAQARRGDAAAFELLARRHYGTAFSVALAVMGNRADAGDVCHDGLVRALFAAEDVATTSIQGPPAFAGTAGARSGQGALQ